MEWNGDKLNQIINGNALTNAGLITQGWQKPLQDANSPGINVQTTPTNEQIATLPGNNPSGGETDPTVDVDGGGGLLSQSNLRAPDPVLLEKQKALGAKGYQGKGYDAGVVGVSQNALTGSRLNQLLDGNSQYIQQARQRAMQLANSRGMLNSTMAAGASERAAIDAAMPIAQDEAGAFREREMATMNAQNQAREFGSNASNQSNQFNAAAQNDMSKFNTDLASQTDRFNAGAQNDMSMNQWSQLDNNRHQGNMAILNSSLDTNSRERLQGLMNDASRLLQSDALYNAGFQSQIQAVTAIQTSTLSPDKKQAMINDLFNQMSAMTTWYNTIQRGGTTTTNPLGAPIQAATGRPAAANNTPINYNFAI